MSDSKLLAENTIRRFMKLANTEALSDNFVNEKFNAEELEEENELEEDTLEEAEEEGHPCRCDELSRLSGDSRPSDRHQAFRRFLG